MADIKVIVTERDYDVEWGVGAYDPEIDDLDDSVTVDATLYEEYVQMINRLDELEEIFLSLVSVNEQKCHDEYEAQSLQEKKHREEVQVKVKATLASDKGYVDAQGRLGNGLH